MLRSLLVAGWRQSRGQGASDARGPVGHVWPPRPSQGARGQLQTPAERLRQNDFIPWKRGISL